jgi:hypothetical protein
MNSLKVIEHFKALHYQLNELAEHISNDLASYPVWVMDKGELTNNRNIAEKIFLEFSHHSNLGQETLSCPGSIAGNLKTVDLVKNINEAKSVFQATCSFYLKMLDTRDTQPIRKLLGGIGYPDIKLRQIYRKINYINFHPRKISFTLSKHNSHRVVSKKEALDKLNKLGQGSHIHWQCDLIKKMDDEKIVIHDEIKPIWAVNLSTFKKEDGKSDFMKILTRLPIIYLHDFNLPPPQVNFSRGYERKNNSPRADKKIETEPFLPSLRGYKYKKE